MKKISFTSLSAAALVACSLSVFSAGASAQATWTLSTTYNYGSGTGSCNVPGGCAGSGGLGQLNVSGWGSINGGFYVQGPDLAASTNPNYAQTYKGLSNQGGSGLGFTSKSGSTNETRASPDHAFDNSGGTGSNASKGADNELLLLDFGSAKVNLTQIQTGWSSVDTDVMVFRWDGTDSPTMGSVAGPTGLTGAGWNLVAAKDMDGQAGNLSNDIGSRTFKLDGSEGTGFVGGDDADKVSSWWLVTTYFGSDNTTHNLGKGNDFFKLLSFSAQVCDTAGNSELDGNTCKKKTPPPPADVPEPATMALAGLALFGMAAQRRRRKLVAA